jgi:regulator of sigma E protease
MSTLYGILAVIAAFLLLIGSHEGGHFSIAKLVGMRVHEFSIGFGTRLWSVTRGETLYAVRAFPLGGYVRLGGMEPGEYDLPDGFHTKPAFQRFAVLAAGPLANFITASILIALILLPHSAADAATIDQVVPGSPAAAAGISTGDVVVAADGRSLDGDAVQTLKRIENAKPGAPLHVAVRRPDGTRRELALTPRYDRAQGAYIIGVQLAEYTPLTAVGTALAFPWLTIRDIGVGIWQVATGSVPGGLGGPNGVTGPIGISRATYSAAEQGVDEYLGVLALLSVALGLTNLLPVPALDGGRIAVVLIEAVRRRPFDRQREMAVQRFGLVALMALIAVVSYIDVSRMINHQ